MVTTPSCVRLSTLSSILCEEYRRRTALSSKDDPDPKKVKEADAGIRRTHELLTAHRKDCPMCIAHEREVRQQCGTRKPVNSERDLFRLDRVG